MLPQADEAPPVIANEEVAPTTEDAGEDAGDDVEFVLPGGQ